MALDQAGPQWRGWRGVTGCYAATPARCRCTELRQPPASALGSGGLEGGRPPGMPAILSFLRRILATPSVAMASTAHPLHLLPHRWEKSPGRGLMPQHTRQDKGRLLPAKPLPQGAEQARREMLTVDGNPGVPPPQSTPSPKLFPLPPPKRGAGTAGRALLRTTWDVTRGGGSGTSSPATG